MASTKEFRNEVLQGKMRGVWTHQFRAKPPRGLSQTCAGASEHSGRMKAQQAHRKTEIERDLARTRSKGVGFRTANQVGSPSRGRLPIRRLGFLKSSMSELRKNLVSPLSSEAPGKPRHSESRTRPRLRPETLLCHGCFREECSRCKTGRSDEREWDKPCPYFQ